MSEVRQLTRPVLLVLKTSWHFGNRRDNGTITSRGVGFVSIYSEWICECKRWRSLHA